MKLGDNIQKLRKELKLSQEQLAEKIDVTRQTISNWELGETSPNPEQLKLLSKALNVSVDELLNNDVKSVIIDKVSNTEKLAGIIIKILKVIGILFVTYFIIGILAIFLFSVKKQNSTKTFISNQTTQLECTIDKKTYQYMIETDSDDNLIEASGSEYIENILTNKKFNRGKIMIEYIMLTIYNIKNILDGKFNAQYLVDYPTSLFQKEKKGEQILKIIEDPAVQDKIKIKIKYKDFVENKEKIYELMQRGFKFAIIIDETFKIETEEIRKLLMFDYVLISKSNKNFDNFMEYKEPIENLIIVEG